MSFMDRKPFSVNESELKGFTRFGERFNCSLCGKVFAVGDVARWIYANFKGSPVRCGNFFVCDKCDGTDTEVLERGAYSFKQAVKLAKQWGVYGPDWQKDSR